MWCLEESGVKRQLNNLLLDRKQCALNRGDFTIHDEHHAGRQIELVLLSRLSWRTAAWMWRARATGMH
jgi:hypothetical protein